ncbi:tail length tape measure protein [Idiomarinaceae phage 1N2-2]|uniref:tail length tape measure protein n=1 Tax=Idiomarinaceae phage 1N2-2 TaxID=1536592 RepID=UPI0004F6AEF2|nr:tail length tape measure protein [Idiomarinaceae phage 1N2-2]AIM40723.1 putative tail tape measure protein [Idiomarinaceae phage 1N2-2]
MSQIGALSIRISADGSQANRELRTVNQRVKDTGKQLRENANRWARWGIAAAGAAAAVATAMVRSQMKTIDELGKMSRQLNVNVESLQALRHQAELSGMSTSELDTNLERLTRRMGQAARDGGRTADTIESLGLSVKDLADMRADEQLDLLAKAINGVENTAQRAAIANDLFGRSGGRMLNMLQDMEGGIEPVLTHLEQMGALLSQEEVTMIEAANDAIHEAGTALNTVWQRAAVELAPIIQALAGEIVAASKDMGGFGNTALDVMDGIAKAVGVAANAFHGWRMIIRGMQTAFYGLSRVVSEVMASILEAVNSTLRFAAEGVNSLIRGMNRIPRVDLEEIVVGESEMAGKFRQAANDARIEMADAMFEMQNLANQELPSEGIQRWVGEVRKAANEAAQLLRRGGDGGDDDEGDDTNFMFTRDENEKWLEQLRERYKTEAEIQEDAHKDEMDRLKELRDMELLTEQEYQHERERMGAAHADAMARIQEQERRQRVGIMSGMMQNLSQLMNTGSKKMFAIGKAAAIANALIQGREAVVSSYAAGARIGGPPVGAAYAATAAAATAAQISQIRSSSFGGAGGGAGTFSNGVPAVRTTDAGGGGAVNPSQVVDINITGSGTRFTADEVRSLIGQINEQVGDGVNLNFNGG